jgi:ribosome-binding factor A
MTLRTDRVASLIRHELGMLFTTKYRDPGFGLITVTDVQVTPDLRIAKVYVSVLGGEKVRAAAMKQLELDKKALRLHIASHLRLKYTPELQIYQDTTLDRVERIDEIIRQIHSGDGGSR